QRNWAIDNIPTRYEWQLHLDADERMTPELAAEIAAVLATAPSVGGDHMPRKLMFGGRGLRPSRQYPGYQVRVVPQGRFRDADPGHGRGEGTDLPVGRLTEPSLHYAFPKGLDKWFAKHAVYARQEAEQARAGSESRGGGLLSRDPIARRRAMKQ